MQRKTQPSYRQIQRILILLNKYAILKANINQIKFHTLLIENKDAIADAIVAENGKTKIDAIGDITRGIEVCQDTG